MSVKQGDKFTYNATNGIEQTIEVTSDIGTHISYRHIQGRAAAGSVHRDYFEQLISTNYFTKVE